MAYNPNAPMFDLVGYTLPANSGAGSSTKRLVQRESRGLQSQRQNNDLYSLRCAKRDRSAGKRHGRPYAGYNIGQTLFNNSVIVSMTHTFSPRFVSQSKLDFNRFNTVQPVSPNGVVPSYYLGNANTSTSIGPLSSGAAGR